jgi:L-ornithine N5-oxygenase
MMDTLYRQLYLDRLNGRGRLRIITMHDVTAARDEGDEVVLELTDRCTGATQELRVDLVLVGTGFATQMPAMVRRLAAAVGMPEVSVTRDYRMVVDRPSTAACYLHGVNEATHGISDSLLAVLATRATDILRDIHTHRQAHRESLGRPKVPATATVAG